MTNDECKYGRTREQEVAQFLRDAEARDAAEYRRNFWYGKTPCWKMTNCPDSVKNACPAPEYPSLPCWQIEGTYCKLDERNANGLDTSICKQCPVFEQYGGRTPLKIKFFTSDQHH